MRPVDLLAVRLLSWTPPRWVRWTAMLAAVYVTVVVPLLTIVLGVRR